MVRREAARTDGADGNRGGAVTPEKLKRLAYLQQHPSYALTVDQHDELDALCRELAMAPEVADDPKTLFTDESRRPELDGTDYNDRLKAMTCGEVEAVLRKGLQVLGDVALKAIVARVLP